MSRIDLRIVPGTVGQDLRYGARLLCCNVGFTMATVLTLALGIGVNLIAFTAYKAFFYRSLDAHDPRQTLTSRWSTTRAMAITSLVFSYPDYEAYGDGLQSFSD